MNDIFKQTDSFRVSVEAEAAREAEAKAKLVRESENSLINKFTQYYGNGSIVEETKTELSRIAAETSEGISFDGSISITAQVADNDGEKVFTVTLPVKASAVELLSDSELQRIISETAAKEIVLEHPNTDMTVIEASLSEFTLLDDGSDFLQVFHPSLDTGKAIGVVAKSEYNKASSKEALLTSILSDGISNTYAAQTHELKFAGSFVEPSIQIEADKAKVKPWMKDDGETDEEAEAIAEDEERREKEASEEVVFLSHQADSYRQATESEAQAARAAFEKTATQATNSLVSYLHGLNYGSVKVLSTDTSDDTRVVVTASLFDNVGEKIVSISLPIRDAQFALPAKQDVHNLIASTTDLRTKIAEEFEKETLEQFSAIDELEAYNERETEAALSEDGITKTAADSGGMQFVGPVDVLKIDKHSLGMPDLEIGETVYVDGFTWQLTSKEDNNLGKEADSGSLWTLTKVSPAKGEPENRI